MTRAEKYAEKFWKEIEMRNKKATDAWLRSGAGPMKDRREPKGGTTNESRDLLAEAEEEVNCWNCGVNTDNCECYLASAWSRHKREKPMDNPMPPCSPDDLLCGNCGAVPDDCECYFEV